jgi:hypothetical protein
MRASLQVVALVVSLVLAAVLPAGCGGPGLAASLVKVPKYTPAGETTCGIVPSPSRPLVVEWPALDRAALEARAKQGLVAVRYVGCDIEVLPQCAAPARYAYAYTATTTKHDTVHIQNEDDLYSNLPLGAAKLEAKLERAGELRVDMTIVGRYAAALQGMPRNELVGPDCARATHVISGLTVGEFALTAAGRAAVAGQAQLLAKASARAASTASEEDLAQDGDAQACARATAQDGRPPDGCAAPLRIEVTPIGAFRPECPEGYRLQAGACYPELVRQCDPGTRFVEGRGCVPDRAVPVSNDCPAGTSLRDGWCMPLVTTACTAGMRFVSGTGCVPIDWSGAERTTRANEREREEAAAERLDPPHPLAPYTPHPLTPEVARAEDLLAAGEVHDGIAAAVHACDTGDGLGCGLAGEWTRRGGEGVRPDAERGAGYLRRGCGLRDPWSCSRVEALRQANAR